LPSCSGRGHNVLAVQLPLTSLPEDVAWTRHVLAERLAGPTVLAGHSYGGAVIAGAATGVENVVGLVFASAFAPNEGESLGGLGSRFPPPPGLAHTQTDSLGFLWFDPAAVPTYFAQDIPVEEARVLAAVQSRSPRGPLPTWRGRRRGGRCRRGSWSTQDRMINPDLERFMAARIGATTVEVRSSHASPASHPHQIAKLILAAAHVGTRA
jgi:pimeloyl-ACP methyl ester carboxylesterase